MHIFRGRREEEADINGSLIPSGLPATNSGRNLRITLHKTLKKYLINWSILTIPVSSSGVSVSGSGTAPTLSMSSSQALVTPRRTNTSVTIINHNNNAAIVAASQVILGFNDTLNVCKLTYILRETSLAR